MLLPEQVARVAHTRSAPEVLPVEVGAQHSHLETVQAKCGAARNATRLPPTASRLPTTVPGQSSAECRLSSRSRATSALPEHSSSSAAWAYHSHAQRGW